MLEGKGKIIHTEKYLVLKTHTVITEKENAVILIESIWDILLYFDFRKGFEKVG